MSRKFKAYIKNKYLEYDPQLNRFRIKKMFGHREFAATDITAYRLTIDDTTIAESNGKNKALIDNSLFSDASIMGITSPGTKMVFKVYLTIETSEGPIVIKFINTRTEVGTPVYSLGLLDADKALQQLDALR